jgi:hypothetical protein
MLAGMAVAFVLAVACVLFPLARFLDAQRKEPRKGSLYAKHVALARKRVMAYVVLVVSQAPFYVILGEKPPHTEVLRALGILAMVILLYAVTLLAKGVKLATTAWKLRPIGAHPATTDIPTETQTIDIGIGDEHWVNTVDARSGAYRGSVTTFSRAHGDARILWQVWIAPLFDGLLVLIALLVVGIDVSMGRT